MNQIMCCRGYCWLLIVCLLGICSGGSFAQLFDIDVVETELSDGQFARIVPLYEDLDFFFDMAFGAYDAADFDRDERFIYQCGAGWYEMVEAFGIDIPANPSRRYMRQWSDNADSFSDDIVAVIEDTLQDAADILPGSHILVCVVPAPPSEQSSSGTEIYGVAVGVTTVVAIGDLRSGWEVELATTIAHEYHHVIRNQAPERRETGNSLLERVVVEGMAITFAEMVVPDYEDPVTAGLSRREEREIWREMEPELRSDSREVHDRYMRGGQDGIPFNAGYTIGYHIVQDFIAHNRRVPLEEWSFMSGQEIYEASRYRP